MVIFTLLDGIKLPLLVFTGTVLVVSTLQWTGIQFLSTYCSPWALSGPIQNIFSLGSPVCHAVNQFQIRLSEHYITLWIGAGGAAFTWLCSKFPSLLPSN
jgi:hypothetical protein